MKFRWPRHLSSPQGVALLGILIALLAVSWSTPAKTQDSPSGTAPAGTAQSDTQQGASTEQAMTSTSAAILAASATQAATPVPPLPLSYDHAINGAISDTDPVQSWPFVVKGSDRLSLMVRRTGGTLVPKISLFDAQGHVLAAADHDASGAQATIGRVVLPAAGAYTVVVGRYGDTSGETQGTYQLTAVLLGSGPDTPGLFDNPEPLNLYFAPGGSLTNKQWLDRWQITLQSSVHLNLIVLRKTGNLIPTITVIGPDNRVIGSADADATQSEAVLDVLIPTPGVYIFQVARANGADGITEGSYIGYPKTVAWGPDADIYGIVQGRLPVDTARQGNLNTGRWQDTWLMTLSGPTLLTITANRCSGTLIPLLTLLDANHKPLATAQPDERMMTMATIDHYQAAAGDYYVVMGRLDGMNGQTAGSYSLMVSSGAGGHTQSACPSE